MLERINHLKPAIVQYSCENRLPFEIRPKHWTTVANILLILKPFYDATLQLSNDSALISEAIPSLLAVKCKLDRVTFTADADELSLLEALKLRITQDLEHRVELIDKQMLGLTLLDPRFKDRAFGPRNKHNARKILLSLYNQRVKTRNCAQLLQATSIAEDLSSSSDEELAVETTTDANEKPGHLWETLLLDTGEEQGGEVQNYLHLPLSKIGENVMQFSMKNRQTFPILFELAKIFLAIPAASVPCERLFLVSGKIASPSRNRIKPENLNKLVLLRHNM